EPAGTPCPEDGDPCTADVCDGAGACAHRPTTVFDRDGVRCAQTTLTARAGAVTCAGRCAAKLAHALDAIRHALDRVDETSTRDTCDARMDDARQRTAAFLRRLDALVAGGRLTPTPDVEGLREAGFALYRRVRDGAAWCGSWR